MKRSPEPACLTCQMPGPPPEQTCTLGHDHRVGTSAGCPACGRLTAACARRPCSTMRKRHRKENPDMTPADELTARVFRALYQGYDLRTLGVVHIVTPKGTPVFIGDSLGRIARQLSENPGPDPARMPSPAPRHDAAGSG